MTRTVRPIQIATLLDTAPEGVGTLSLDCFDTLLWRATHLPQDVFADLGLAGGGIEPRVHAECEARRRAVRGGSGEVSIEQIHAYLPGDAAARVAAELALEARHCFAFAPTVALIRAAKARGWQVIVVSDTYLAEPQLRALIAAVGGDDLAAMIDRIFCSSEIGRSKSGGMFADVIAALGVAPETILHVGDNAQADGVAATAAGLHAVHIEQFDAAALTILRLETAAAITFDPATRVSCPAIQPHRAAIALRPDGDRAWTLGHDVIGPVFDAFSRWLKAEVAALAAATGRSVKPLFLLRDGFLPLAMYEAIGGTGAAVSISRFTARRASLSDEAAIRAYLEEEKTDRLDVLAAQLGLSAEEARRIAPNAAHLRKAVLVPEMVKRIATRSAAFAKRMAAHVTKEARVERGDVVVLVDLGYRGTAQDLAAPVLEKLLGVTVTGRYLLLANSRADRDAKRGMIDAEHYDHRMLTALARQVAIVEQVATSNRGSAIDYADNGRSQHKPNRLDTAQAETRAAIQAGAIAFARTGEQGFHRAPASDDLDARRRMALATLARLLFLPQPDEVAVFARFQHDVNLGTDDLVGIVDRARAGEGLRRRGLPYLHGANRMFLPGELQSNGFPLTLSFLLASRFELDIRVTDFAVTELPVPVLLADGSHQARQLYPATPTHDGYHVVNVPVGAGRFTAGIELGAVGAIVQIEHAAFYRLSDFKPSREGAPVPIAASPVFDAMEALADGLWRCAPHSLLFVPPPAEPIAEPLMLSVVFRPIVAAPVADEGKAAQPRTVAA